MRREVVGDEHVPVVAGEVAEVGAHRLKEAVVCHVPNFECPIAGYGFQYLGQAGFGL